MPDSPALPCFMYLVRHGATEINLAKPSRLQGRGANLGLAEIGRRQAEAAAQFLATRRLDAAYTSPMRRAQETAQAIAGRHHLVPQVVEEIIEVDVGRWESQSWVEIEQNEPEAYRHHMEDPGRHGYSGGENFQSVQDRVSPALLRLMQSHPGQHILVVAHNIVNRAYLCGLLGLPLAHSRNITQTNCGLNIIRLKDGTAEVRTLNATFHLEHLQD